MTAGQELAQAMTQRLPERAGLWVGAGGGFPKD